MPQRIQRVNELIRRELGQIIIREMEFPVQALATITRVETSVDLNQAKIYISVIPEEKKSETIKFLAKNIYQLQQFLNKRLKMRPTPRIYFVGEKETARAGRIEELLEELKKEEE